MQEMRNRTRQQDSGRILSGGEKNCNEVNCEGRTVTVDRDPSKVHFGANLRSDQNAFSDFGS